MSSSTSTCAHCKSSENLKVCSACKKTSYCSRECQRSDWKSHKKDCNQAKTTASGTIVQGVKIKAGSNLSYSDRFQAFQFRSDDPIFTRGELCPFTQLYNIPIILRQTGNTPQDNQPSVYLRIEPESGFAPAQWQLDYPGDCYAIRQDKKPLSKYLVETMYNFHSSKLSSTYFEEEFRDRVPVTPQEFREFSERYWSKERERGRDITELLGGEPNWF